MRAALLLLAVALTALAARADLPVAPPPRAIADDGSRPPVPAPEPPKKAEDPAAVVERIIKNSKDVGDRLAKTDTGTDTRGTQQKILKDIDDLINRQDDPPPPKDNKDNKDNKDDKNKDKKDMNPDMPPPTGDMMKDKGMDMGMGMGKDKDMGMPMGKDMGMGMPKDMGMGMGMPMGGMGDAPPKSGERRPRMGDPNGGDKKDKSDKSGKGMDHPPIDKNKEPKDKTGKDQKPSEGKNPKGGTSGGGTNGKEGKPGGLPFDDDVAKDVWGHLPDKLRQQMTQFYKDDVMPKYADLLKLYYSSLSDKGQPPAPAPAVPKK
jgi:hypothetical protein